MIVQLSDDAEIDLLVAIDFYEKHGTHVGDLFFEKTRGLSPSFCGDSPRVFVLCQKTLKRFLEWTYGVPGPFGPVLEMQVRTRELTGWNEKEETKARFSIVSFVAFAANGR